MRKLNLNKLGTLSGITHKVSQFYYEAAVYSFKVCGHKKGEQIEVFGASEEKFELFWDEEIDDDVVKSWKDEDELIEYGATGIALLLLISLTDFNLFERSPKGTGADFWIGKINEEGKEEFIGLLEVSGLKKETPDNRMNSRMNKRIKRMELSPYRNIPFFLFIVEFQSLRVKYYKNER